LVLNSGALWLNTIVQSKKGLTHHGESNENERH